MQTYSKSSYWCDIVKYNVIISFLKLTLVRNLNDSK